MIFPPRRKFSQPCMFSLMIRLIEQKGECFLSYESPSSNEKIPLHVFLRERILRLHSTQRGTLLCTPKITPFNRTQYLQRTKAKKKSMCITVCLPIAHFCGCGWRSYSHK